MAASSVRGTVPGIGCNPGRGVGSMNEARMSEKLMLARVCGSVARDCKLSRRMPWDIYKTACMVGGRTLS